MHVISIIGYNVISFVMIILVAYLFGMIWEWKTDVGMIFVVIYLIGLFVFVTIELNSLSNGSGYTLNFWTWIGPILSGFFLSKMFKLGREKFYDMVNV